MNQPDPQRRIAGGVEYELTRRRVRNLNIRGPYGWQCSRQRAAPGTLEQCGRFCGGACRMGCRGAGPDGGPHGKPCRRTAAAEQSHRPAPDAGTMCAVLPAVCRHLPARRNAPHSGAGHEHPVGELLPKNRNAVFCPAAVCDAAARAGVCGGTRVLPLCPPQPQPGFLGRRGQGDARL